MMSPYCSTNDHGQRTELERPATPNSISDGATEQAPDKGSTQADAHHQSCTQQRHCLSNQKQKVTKTAKISSRNGRYLRRRCCRRSQGRRRCSPGARSPPCIIAVTAPNEHEFQMRGAEQLEARAENVTTRRAHAPGVVPEEERGERGDADVRQRHAPRRARASVRRPHCGNGETQN